MKRPVPGHFGVLAAALLGLAGCQHTFSRPAAPDAAPTAGREPDARQKADMKVAGGQMLERNGNDVQAAFAYRQGSSAIRATARPSLAWPSWRQNRASSPNRRNCMKSPWPSVPRNPAVLRNKGYSLFLQHRYEDARMILRQSLLLDPTSTTAHNNLGRVLAQLRAIDESIDGVRPRRLHQRRGPGQRRLRPVSPGPLGPGPPALSIGPRRRSVLSPRPPTACVNSTASSPEPDNGRA